MCTQHSWTTTGPSKLGRMSQTFVLPDLPTEVGPTRITEQCPASGRQATLVDKSQARSEALFFGTHDFLGFSCPHPVLRLARRFFVLHELSNGECVLFLDPFFCRSW